MHTATHPTRRAGDHLRPRAIPGGRAERFALMGGSNAPNPWKEGLIAYSLGQAVPDDASPEWLAGYAEGRFNAVDYLTALPEAAERAA